MSRWRRPSAGRRYATVVPVPSPTSHAVLDQVGRRLGRRPLLLLEVRQVILHSPTLTARPNPARRATRMHPLAWTIRSSATVLPDPLGVDLHSPVARFFDEQPVRDRAGGVRPIDPDRSGPRGPPKPASWTTSTASSARSPVTPRSYGPAAPSRDVSAEIRGLPRSTVSRQRRTGLANPDRRITRHPRTGAPGPGGRAPGAVP